MKTVMSSYLPDGYATGVRQSVIKRNIIRFDLVTSTRWLGLYLPNISCES